MTWLLYAPEDYGVAEILVQLDDQGWYWDSRIPELYEVTENTWATPEAAVADLNERLRFSGLPFRLCAV